jgi:secreted trypsin-like serine protease
VAMRLFRPGMVVLTCTVALCWPAAPGSAQQCRHASAEARPKIVGGQPAQLKDWPGQAVLRIHAKEANSALYICGGAALNEHWILTAAHCFEGIAASDLTATFYDARGQSHVGALEVVLGIDNLDALRHEHVYDVDKVVLREGYEKAETTGQDIALIRLKTPYKGPVARLSLDSSTDPQTPPGAQVRVAGFGALKAGVSPNTPNTYSHPDGHEYQAMSKRLQETAVPTVAIEQCRARYPNSKIDAEQICAGLEEGGKDSCQGDSGGPLLAYDRRGCPFQIGVVSWGVGCAGARDYGVYTRVSHHAAWIRTHTGPLEAVALEDTQPSEAQAVATGLTELAILQLEDVLRAAKDRIRIGIRGGNRVAVGRQVVFEAQSSVPGRLIIIDINAAGEVFQLLPNKYTPAHTIGRVTAGANLIIPGPGYGFTGFRAVDPLGKGKLIALVVPENFPFSALVGDVERVAKGFVPVNTPVNYLMNLVQQVVTEAAKRNAADSELAEWGFGVADYEIIR